MGPKPDQVEHDKEAEPDQVGERGGTEAGPGRRVECKQSQTRSNMTRKLSRTRSANGMAPKPDQVEHDKQTQPDQVGERDGTELDREKTEATEGVTYQFKLHARNIVGDSADSSTVTILAASVPATPVAPVTTLSGSDIVVTWTKPAIMGSYGIQLQDKDSNW